MAARAPGLSPAGAVLLAALLAPAWGAAPAQPTGPGTDAGAGAGTQTGTQTGTEPDTETGTGAEAFDRGDYAAARALWEAEARAGSAQAVLRLGVMADLGLGGPRDPALALRRYEEAARAGIAEAQFNAGVMRDSGVVGPRDARAAAGWYSRAAAGGHRRSQYNLGLMFGAGDGVARNADLARHWTARAAEGLSAAADRLEGLAPAEPPERRMEAPTPIGGAVVEATPGEARHVELAWSAPPGPAGAPFEVELARGPEGPGSGALIAARRTEGSALRVDLPGPEAGGTLIWRVLRVDPEGRRYAASAWRGLGGADVDGPPARVRLRVGAADPGAERLAAELSSELAGAGFWTLTERLAAAPEVSAVRYAYPQDAPLARGLAAFLPVLTADDAALDAAPDLRPGELVVSLSGGPAAGD